MIYAVSHLVDDGTVGGVTRMLDHLVSVPGAHRHAFQVVRRGRLSPPKIAADAIVSHLSVCWRNLPLFAALRAAYPRTPLIHVEHSYSEAFAAQRVGNHGRFETLLRTVYSLFDGVVAVSEEQNRWMRRRRFCRPEHLWTIESCADLSAFADVAPRARGPLTTVAAIGRFDVQKGFDVLIDAFKTRSLRDVQLRLYGGGAEDAGLRARAEGAPNIAFMGFAKDPAQAMEACDAVAMPSRWEPFGMVATEAMAAGRTVLCSRVDGLKDHIARGAIEVAQNVSDQWAAVLSGLAPDDLSAAEELGRTRTLNADTRFRAAWSDLVEEYAGKRRGEALAA